MGRVHSHIRDRGEPDSELHFLVERRGKLEDADLKQVFWGACDGDSHWGRMPGLSIELADKKANHPRLQAADLVNTPIERYVHRPDLPNRAFEMIRKKFLLSAYSAQSDQ